MVSQLHEFGNLVRRLRTKGRRGRLTRAPLKLLRLELRDDVVGCEWLIRSADTWDADLPVAVGQRNVTVQSLEDALEIRDALFIEISTVGTAMLRAFRQFDDGETELVIRGTVTRGEEVPKHVSSLAMRAKLLGFRFLIEDGILQALRSEEYALSF